MKGFYFVAIITTLIFASTVWADGPTIVETDSGYVVEYTGTPNTENNNSTRIQRAEYLAKEIDRLSSEPPSEKNYIQMKAYAEELRTLRDESKRNVEDLKRKFAEDNERFRQKYEPRK